ncbi:unnamed protein product [Symbiodinium sp. CCMP2592]|nr:unnamed protein product [Symbiodinium sp. CCMP2592]
MVRRCLRRLAAVLARGGPAQLQQQVEDLLAALDPLGLRGMGNPLWGRKRQRDTTEFSEVARLLRGMADRLPTALSNVDLAEDMAVRIAMLSQGIRRLEAEIHDQGGLQALEAREGAYLAVKAMTSARDKALSGDRDWLSANWLWTVASLLEEGDALSWELRHVPGEAHGSDVLAMAAGANETYGDMPDVWKAKQYLKELGGLLPFLADNDADQARRLVATLLAWVQSREGTTLMVDSQGNAETQEAEEPPSIFEAPVPTSGGHVAIADLDGDESGGTAGEVSERPRFPAYWNLRGSMAVLEVPSSAERDPESFPSDPGPPSEDSRRACAPRASRSRVGSLRSCQP